MKNTNDSAPALRCEVMVSGASRKPKFAEWMRGIHASPQNPQREGMYVRTVVRTGNVNRGRWYELTDGKGKFYQYRPEDTIFMTANPQSDPRE